MAVGAATEAPQRLAPLELAAFLFLKSISGFKVAHCFIAPLDTSCVVRSVKSRYRCLQYETNQVLLLLTGFQPDLYFMEKAVRGDKHCSFSEYALR